MSQNKIYYSASDLIPILEMKYTSVCHLLKKNGIQKIEGCYRVTEEQVQELLHRKNQTIKFGMFNDFLSYNKKIMDDYEK